MMYRLDVPTKRGVLLNGVLFRNTASRKNDTVTIAITGIHGNFYSNPFYYNVGDTLKAAILISSMLKQMMLLAKLKQ